MKALLGIWHSEVVLFVREKPAFTALLTLERDEDQCGVLRLQKDTQGGRDACLHKVDAEERMDYPWEFRTARPENDGFARCSLMPVVLKRVDRYDLIAQLPHDHLLPWPCAKDCQEYVASEELAKDLELRRRHAVMLGARFPTPPGNIIAAMTAKQRKALFSHAA